MNDDLKILREFIKIPISSSDAVMERFTDLPGSIFRGDKKQRFVYIPGSRKNKVLLIAHGDTIWDKDYVGNSEYEQKLILENGIIRSGSTDFGIGADDRAGCAILLLLKALGHSLLISDGEEGGCLGSRWLMEDPNNRDIADLINHQHQFMVQFDRKNGKDFKCYNVGTDVFRDYITEKTGYTEPDRKSRTDIVELCRDVSGVNLSVGYDNEHEAEEFLNLDQWQNTLNLCRRWLSEKELPKFTRNHSDET